MSSEFIGPGRIWGALEEHFGQCAADSVDEDGGNGFAGLVLWGMRHQQHPGWSGWWVACAPRNCLAYAPQASIRSLPTPTPPTPPHPDVRCDDVAASQSFH